MSEGGRGERYHRGRGQRFCERAPRDPSPPPYSPPGDMALTFASDSQDALQLPSSSQSYAGNVNVTILMADPGKPKGGKPLNSEPPPPYTPPAPTFRAATSSTRYTPPHLPAFHPAARPPYTFADAVAASPMRYSADRRNLTGYASGGDVSDSYNSSVAVRRYYEPSEDDDQMDACDGRGGGGSGGGRRSRDKIKRDQSQDRRLKWQVKEKERKGDSGPKASLVASLRFSRTFQNLEEVRGAIEGLLKLPQGRGQSQVVFKNVVQHSQRNETVCDFIVSDLNLQMIKSKLQKSVFLLRKQLSTGVELSLESLSQGFSTQVARFDPSLDRKRATRKEREAVSKWPQPIPQALKVTVETGFGTSDLFMQFVKLSLSGTASNFQIDEESVSLSDSSCSCVINVDSRADEKRLKHAFEKVSETINIRVNCCRQSKAGEDKDSKLTEAFSYMKVAKQESLQIHDKKISFYRGELQSLQDAINRGDLSQFQSEYVSAIKNKIFQLNHHKSEFLIRCTLLEQSMEKNDAIDVGDKEISKFLESVGRECNHLTTGYPVYASRKAFLAHMKYNQVCVISGGPGSGIRTQLVQYLLEAHYADNNNAIIVSCQRDKNIAQSLAEKVAKELVSRVGGIVGYKTTTNGKLKKGETKILFTTYDSLLNECVQNPDLEDYKCIILNDAQDLTEDMKTLMSFLWTCLRRNHALRVIVSLTKSSEEPSSTLVDFFNSKTEINVSGQPFPVEVFHDEDTPDSFENYEMRAVSKAAEIHSNGVPGDILVFLSTSLEIMRCCQAFEKRFKGRTNFKCISLHSHLAQEEMRKAFEMVPEGVRRVIFATAIAETSMAVADVKFVVDTGIIAQKAFHERRTAWISSRLAISKKCAERRKHVAGFNPAGICYRLYSKDDFDTFDDRPCFETNLSPSCRMILKFKELNVVVNEEKNRKDLESAYRMLNKLGGLATEEITEAGKWMSRLPYDFVNNSLIYKAAKHNLIYDAIVLATQIFFDGEINLFYQPLSDSESCDLSENRKQLASQYGDVFTALNIFKTWSLLSKNDKAIWCRNNSVNYKALGFVRNCVEDTAIILNEQLGVDGKKVFSEEASAINTLREIIFDLHIASVSHSTDKGKACYTSLADNCTFAVHPDSSLVALDVCPEWIVFTGIEKACQELIRGIVAVDEEWVQRAVESKRVQVDLTDKKMPLVYHGKFGAVSFKRMTGPGFEKLSWLADAICKTSEAKSSIEANKLTGTLDIYSHAALPSDIATDLNKMKGNIKTNLQADEKAFGLDVLSAAEFKDTRILIGQGGIVKNIVHPKQSNQVLITLTPESARISDVVSKFEEYGHILEVNKFESQKAWGAILFGSILEAMNAVEGMNGNKCYSCEIPKSASSNHQVPNVLEAKVSWLEPSQAEERHAIVQCSPLERPALIGCFLKISGNFCEINACPKIPGNLVIMHIGDASETDIAEKLTQELKASGLSSANLNVSLSTESDKEKSPGTRSCESQRETLQMILKKHVKEGDCFVRSPYMCQNDTRYVCFVQFPDSVKGEKVCHEATRRYDILGKQVEFKPCYSTTLRVPKVVKEVCEKLLSSVFDSLHQSCEGFSVAWRQRGEDFAIVLQSARIEGMADARERVLRVLEGEVVDCSSHPDSDCFLQEWGQNRLATIEHITDCVAITDFRQSKIHLYGLPSNVQHAKDEINSYLSNSGDVQEKELDLKCPALMRSLLIKYGSGLQSLIGESGLKSAELKFKNQSLRVVGSAAAVEEAGTRLRELEGETNKTKGMAKNSFPGCFACKGSTEQGSFYRLEICSHAYCVPCFQGLVSLGLRNKELPLKCVCDEQIVVKDLDFLLSRKLITEKNLVTSALQVAGLEEKNKFIFCPTVNCPMVYEKTEKATGSEFVCLLCFASVCTSCQTPFHWGVTCQQATPSLVTSVRKPDDSRSKLMAWMARK